VAIAAKAVAVIVRTVLTKKLGSINKNIFRK